METYPKTLHIVIYYDEAMASADGNGWCVEFSDSDTTTRFGTYAGALAYAGRFEDTLKSATPVVI